MLWGSRADGQSGGLVVDVRFTPAGVTSERDAALEMLAAVPGAGRITVGTDRCYDTQRFVRGCRKSRVTPHVAQKQRLAIDRLTTRHDAIASTSGPGSELGRSSAG